MGRLGSREMTASSDLDLILLYDFDPEQPDSDGARPLHGAHYFARFTQRLISAFTTRTNYGVLYEVDMRLRPSGRAGPVASHIASFAEYQEREAWTWEHMALTRARVISAPPGFRARIEKIIRDVLTRPRDTAAVANDVAEMRRAIALEKGEDDVWDLKYAAGGMVDIDFIAQYLQLVHAAAMPDILDVSTRQVLDNAARLGVLPQACSGNPACGGASLSRPDADPAALRQRTLQAGKRGRRPVARDGAGRRRPGFFLAAGAGQGNARRGEPGISRDRRGQGRFVGLASALLPSGRHTRAGGYPVRRGLSVQSQMSLEYWNTGSPAFAGDDDGGCGALVRFAMTVSTIASLPPDMRLTLATQRARGFDDSSAPGGRGECRVPSAPAASCAKVVVLECTRVFTAVAPEITRHPRTQWF